MEVQTLTKPEKATGGRHVIRLIGAVVVVLATCSYIVGVILGLIPEKQKLGVADIGVVVLAVGVASILLRPELLGRISHLKLGELELDWLQKLEDDQKKQRDELDDVRFILTLLLQQNELEHLKNLDEGKTQYQGNEVLCGELRKLRTLGLIRNQKGHAMGETAINRKFDLKDIVELTERGRQYLERLGEYDEKK
jgi:hypothetical protein